MVQYISGIAGANPWQDWYALTPDQNGCYINDNVTCSATFAPLASLLNVWSSPFSQYGPLAMASAVLADGKVVVEGGEANLGVSGNTMLGAIYDPVANGWSRVYPPSDFTTIGDAPSAVLSDGTFLLGDPCSFNTALLDESTLNWNSPTGSLKQGWSAEASYTLLPNGSVLTVDTCWPGQGCTTSSNSLNSEAYNPSSEAWSSLGNTPNRLYSYGTGQANSCQGQTPLFGEQGPAVLRPDGTYFAIGGYVTGSAFPEIYTSVYNTATQSWQSSPALPTVSIGGSSYPLDASDNSMAVLPDGNALLFTRAHGYSGSADSWYMIEWNGSSYCQITNTPNSVQFQAEMLMLPTGQVMMTAVDFWGNGIPYFYIYTPAGSPYSGIAPTVLPLATPYITRGSTYTVSGTQFNGATQDSVLGDDFQNATNYPLVRITNNATGHVFYARTHGHSTMGVATGSLPTSTNFDVPSGMETGLSQLVVVANGIASNAISVSVH